MEQRNSHAPHESTQVQHSCSHRENREETSPHIQLELAEQKLHNLEMDLALTLAKRSNLIRRINRYRASLAPCNKLPSELIGEIIILTEPELPRLPLTHRENDPRLQYTQICSHWRRAAFEVNQLWNNVNLERCHTDGLVNLVAAWFRQSSCTQISLKVSSLISSSDAEYLWKELLVPYSHRLKSFDSILFDANHFHSIPFDTLKTLYLLYSTRSSNPGGFMVAPSLQHFRVTNIPPDDDESLVSFLPSIPWEQLTSLSLDGSFSFSDLSDVLLQCKVLENCQLDTVDRDSPGDIQRSVVLTQLHSLQIKFGMPHLFDALFSLSVPNLSTLTVNVPPNAPGVLEKFSKFMTTLRNTLRHLEITKNSPEFRRGEGGPVVEIVHTFPFVTHFVAKELFIAPTTLAKINTGELLPEIEVIEFMAHPGGRIEDIVDTLVARHPNQISRLKDIYIHTDQRIFLGERLKDLHSQGINVWAVYRYPQVPGIEVGGHIVGTWTI